MDKSAWKRLPRESFKELIEMHFADLEVAPDTLQDEVYKKWIRFFDKQSWPLP